MQQIVKVPVLVGLGQTRVQNCFVEIVVVVVFVGAQKYFVGIVVFGMESVVFALVFAVVHVIALIEIVVVLIVVIELGGLLEPEHGQIGQVGQIGQIGQVGQVGQSWQIGQVWGLWQLGEFATFC